MQSYSNIQNILFITLAVHSIKRIYTKLIISLSVFLYSAFQQKIGR